MSSLNEISVPHIKIETLTDRREEIYDDRCLLNSANTHSLGISTMWNYSVFH